MNQIVLTLLEATLTLYPANQDGSPVLNSPIWTGVAAENIEVSDQWIKTETRPTGAKFPRKHPHVPQYEISIERVWILQRANLNGFVPGRSKYVLDITWTEEETGDWHRETYYGVTINNRRRSSRNIDEGHADHQTFDAEYNVLASGQGNIPPIDSTLPYTVRFVDQTGETLLYNYDAGTHVFTAATDTVTTGRATLAYPGGNFQATFSGEPGPAVDVDGSGNLEVTALQAGPPDANRLPRLDFYYGSNRVASITKQGRLYGNSFLEGIPAEGVGRFALYAGSALAATFEQARVTALALHAFIPTSIAGLKFWATAESMDGTPDGTRSYTWPDLSGNNFTLDLGDGIGYAANYNGGPAMKFEQTPPGLDLGQGNLLFHDGPVFNADLFSLFIVGQLNSLDTQGGGAFASSANGFVSLGSDNGQLTGSVHNSALTEIRAIGSSLPMEVFQLLEMELTSTQLLLRRNGSDDGVAAFTGSKLGTTMPFGLGWNGSDLPLNGYERAVLLFQGTLTSVQKAKVRNYLNDRYRVY